MPTRIEDVNQVNEYISGVMGRADHHAVNVRDISLAIIGGVIWRNDGEIKVLTREGKMANVLWFLVDGKRYAISYNHRMRKIEIRKGEHSGQYDSSF